MSSEFNSSESGDQDSKPWFPTPEEFKKLTRWAGELEILPQDLYQETREAWLQDLVREPQDVSRIAPFMKQVFLELFTNFTEPLPLLKLLQHYVEAQPMEKTLINFVLRRLIDRPMKDLVACAVFRAPNSDFWREQVIKFDPMRKFSPLSNMSHAVKALLKRLYIDPLRGAWHWNELDWDWELPLRDRQHDQSCGCVALYPLEHGETGIEFLGDSPPEPWHDDWALHFDIHHFAGTWHQIPDDYFLVRSTLPEVKRQLDLLLGEDTPEIPNE